jgi:prevent-host-death family protein
MIPFMAMIKVMNKVNINEVKARLSEYLDAVAQGEPVVICRRNQPVAELRAVARTRTEPRPIGGGPYSFAVPDSFFEPMPDEFLLAFEAGPVFPAATQPSRVAEAPAPYRAKRAPKAKR